MGIETGFFIDDLNGSWPVSSTDPIQQGANHIRLIKDVLKTTFPGESGEGFGSPIEATEAEINALQGVRTDVRLQDQIALLVARQEFPTGTKLIFYQAAPPPGWTYEQTENDSMLRCTSAFGGLSGGSESPVAMTFNHSHSVNDHTLTIGQIPAHTHTVNGNAVPNGTGLEGGGPQPQTTTGNSVTTSQGGGGPHNHGLTTTNRTFSPRYINVIKGVKS